MTPKFKIGDKVKAHTGPIFVIESISIRKDEIAYYESSLPCSYLEKHLVLFIEPKSKVKKYLYAIKFKMSVREEHSICFYKDDKDFLSHITEAVWFKRLDFSMIEVDE